MQHEACKVFVFVSTPVQVQMFGTIIERLNAVGSCEVRLITLERYYSYPGLEQKVLDSSIPYLSLGEASARRWSWTAVGAAQKFRILLDLRQEVSHLLQSEYPQLLVLGTDVNFVEQVIIQQANVHGIPTLLVSEGLVNPAIVRVPDGSSVASIGQAIKTIVPELARRAQRRILTLLGLTPSGYVMGLHCTKTAVVGEQQRDLLIAHGIEATRIEVTGQPRFDHAFYLAAQRPTLTLPDLGIADGRGLILFAGYLPSQHGWVATEIDDCMLASLVSLARKVQKTHKLLIRPHPSDQIEEYGKRIGVDAPSNILLSREHDLYDLLQAADLLVTNGSTVIAESLIFGVPVLIFPPSDSLYAPYADFEACGVACRAESADQMEGAAGALLYGPDARQAYAAARMRCLPRFLGSSDGCASERVAALMMNMVTQDKQAA